MHTLLLREFWLVSDGDDLLDAFFFFVFFFINMVTIAIKLYTFVDLYRISVWQQHQIDYTESQKIQHMCECCIQTQFSTKKNLHKEGI